tara:strand:+ start:427 stop:636 length:210 start_codon:yes stop_codon:yes gene_type:complete
MKPSKAEKEDIKKTLKKANPAVDLKKDIELLKGLCRNMNDDVLRRINEINLSLEHVMARLRKVEGRLGL